MIAGGLGFYLLLALILVLGAAWTAKKPIGAFFKSLTASDVLQINLAAAQFFPAKRIPSQKNCPHCAEPTPISALICDACEYNFLSGMVGTRTKALPAPGAFNR